MGVAEGAFVDPTSVIDDGAIIGAGSRVWHFCHVMADAVVGADCVLGQNCFVGRGVELGNGVKLQNNVSVYEGVELGDFVFVGPSAVFTNVKNPRANLDRRTEFRRTRVGRGATIGANATILPGVEIGEYAFVGAGATVTSDVPSYAVVVGVPAALSGWMSRSGDPLEFDSAGVASCPRTGERYRCDARGVVSIDGAG